MKKLMMTVMIMTSMVAITGCDFPENDQDRQTRVQQRLSDAQRTPTDIQYSLERYNHIRRAYWVNGMREKAISLPCQLEKPLGHVILMTQGGAVVGKFIVDGKLSSLKNYLTPESDYYSTSQGTIKWLADVDGCYGDNDSGIFFFTPDGKYIEWNGTYLYSDIPFEVSNPVITVKGAN